MNSTRLVKQKPCKKCGADLTASNCAVTNWNKNGNPCYRNICNICYNKTTRDRQRKRAANPALKKFDTERRLKAYHSHLKYEKPMQERDFGKLCPGCDTPITFDNCEFHHISKGVPQYRRWCKACFNYIKCALVNSRTTRTKNPKIKNERDKEKQRGYQKAYYQRNKERMRQQQKEYYEKIKGQQ